MKQPRGGGTSCVSAAPCHTGCQPWQAVHPAPWGRAHVLPLLHKSIRFLRCNCSIWAHTAKNNTRHYANIPNRIASNEMTNDLQKPTIKAAKIHGGPNLPWSGERAVPKDEEPYLAKSDDIRKPFSSHRTFLRPDPVGRAVPVIERVMDLFRWVVLWVYWILGCKSFGTCQYGRDGKSF